ncbi:hypothetical protein MMC09_002027 [Bachmanniomyces sp. S44760]|nr:hypothetical protein [Bachmanniomyces sp. S44760]
MSDLHLEVGQQYATFRIVPRAPSLILAGDIGRLADYGAFRGFLRSQCEQFVQVYLVLGNHEFFGVSRQEGLGLAEELQQENGLKGKLIVMNQRRVDLQNVTILGCTLQSYVPPEAEQIVRLKVNDFRRIKDWTVTNHVAEHAKDVKWLTDEITSIRKTEAGSARKIVVITHHAPSTKGTSNPSHENNPWSSAFGTDLLERKENSCLDDVQWWIFGHTHHSCESTRGAVKLISNQRGYVLPRKDEVRLESQAKLVSKLQRLCGYTRKQPDVFNAEKVIKI